MTYGHTEASVVAAWTLITAARCCLQCVYTILARSCVCLHVFGRSAVCALRSKNAPEDILHQVFAEGPVYTEGLALFFHFILNNVTIKCQNKV